MVSEMSTSAAGRSMYPILLKQILIYGLVMEIAALLAVGLGDWIDFGVIIGILCLNAFVGFYQEKQAADVVASLKGDIAMRAHVVRNGKEEQILARELVPGDIVSISITFPLIHNLKRITRLIIRR